MDINSTHTTVDDDTVADKSRVIAGDFESRDFGGSDRRGKFDNPVIEKVIVSENRRGQRAGAEQKYVLWHEDILDISSRFDVDRAAGGHEVDTFLDATVGTVCGLLSSTCSVT